MIYTKISCRLLTKYFLIIALFTVSDKLSSQIIFSQYYSSHLINPANVGNFFGDYRIGGLHRNETNASSKANIKSTFFCDTRILKSALPENEKLALGGSFFSEGNPVDGIKNNYLLLTMAYHKALNESGDQNLSIGFQTNISNKRIKPPMFVFEDQLKSWGNSGFSITNPFQSKLININYFDFNVGLTYQGRINQTNLITIGLSIFHANHPTQSFDGGEFDLPPQGGIQLTSEKLMPNNSKLFSSFILRGSNINKVEEVIAGCIYQSKISKSNYTINAGTSFRKNTISGNAIIPSIGLGYRHVQLNISYDANISKQTSKLGNALEVGMVFLGMRIPKM